MRAGWFPPKIDFRVFSPRLCSGILFGSLFFLAGCKQSQDPNTYFKKFIPSEETSQKALETALAAWQKGKTPPFHLKEGKPAIEMVDSHFKQGQTLAEFKVLGPTTGGAERCFAALLTLDNPREEVRARYVVAGLDPLWVMRYEDFEMVMHGKMDHDKEKGK